MINCNTLTSINKKTFNDFMNQDFLFLDFKKETDETITFENVETMIEDIIDFVGTSYFDFDKTSKITFYESSFIDFEEDQFINGIFEKMTHFDDLGIKRLEETTSINVMTYVLLNVDDSDDLDLLSREEYENYLKEEYLNLLSDVCDILKFNIRTKFEETLESSEETKTNLMKIRLKERFEDTKEVLKDLDSETILDYDEDMAEYTLILQEEDYLYKQLYNECKIENLNELNNEDSIEIMKIQSDIIQFIENKINETE